MANKFRNAAIIANTSPGTILYTVPAQTTAVVHAIVIANITSSPVSATVQFIDASGSTTFRLVTDAPIPAGGSLYFPKPINLEAADSIRIVASNSASIEAFASILELS
jgi:hypothetical protein